MMAIQNDKMSLVKPCILYNLAYKAFDLSKQTQYKQTVIIMQLQQTLFKQFLSVVHKNVRV